MKNYRGKLYGKIAGVYYPLQETSDDFDTLKDFHLNDLKKELSDFYNFVLEYKDFAPVCAEITVDTYLEHKKQWIADKNKL